MRYILALTCLASPAFADSPIIENVTASPSSNGWRFDVTLSHADTGWEDYADGWRVELEGGEILGTRVLAHPHVNEQPFTRSLSNVAIPEEVGQVYIRAKDLIGGWSEARTPVNLAD